MVEKGKIRQLIIHNFTTESGVHFDALNLSYQTFGLPLHSAPIVLVNHALTGNSNVAGKDGWWSEFVGAEKTIDTNFFTVLAFNVIGCGYDGFLLDDYKSFSGRDAARTFLEGLYLLEINELYAIIGGSVGGGIAWEIAALKPKLAKNLVPIAADWKASDWVIANCYVQEEILNNSSKPIENARAHAMMFYRTPTSFEKKFGRTENEALGMYNVESWLAHHGDKLKNRFQLGAYKCMNYILKSTNILKDRGCFEEVASKIEANIYIVAIDSDLFFTAAENKETYNELKRFKHNVFYKEIQSIHGHDAFLIEYAQLNNLLADVFRQ